MGGLIPGDVKAKNEYAQLLSRIRKSMAAAKVKSVAKEEGLELERGPAKKGVPTSHDLYGEQAS